MEYLCSLNWITKLVWMVPEAYDGLVFSLRPFDFDSDSDTDFDDSASQIKPSYRLNEVTLEYPPDRLVETSGARSTIVAEHGTC